MSQQNQAKLIAAVRSEICKNIPEEFRSKLPIACSKQDPAAILKNIVSLYADGSDKTHRRLKLEAQALKLQPGKSLKIHFEMHKDLRRRMYQSQYPKSFEERITVRLVVKGMDRDPQFSDAERPIRFSGLLVATLHKHSGR